MLFNVLLMTEMNALHINIPLNPRTNKEPSCISKYKYHIVQTSRGD